MDAADWDARYADAELVWSATPNSFVEAECAQLAPGRAVDLACGEGRNSWWLARQGWRVTAVDFSAVAIDKGRRVADDLDIDWVVGDATTWTGSGYDLALIAYLHLPAAQRAAAVRNAFDAVAPGGTFLLVAHDASNLAEGTGGPQDPDVLYTAGSVLADLAEREFTAVHADRVPRVVRRDDGHGSEVELTAWDCLVRLTRA